MKLSFISRTSLLCLIFLFTSSCAPKPGISDVFKEQLTRFFEEGTTLTSMTAQGVNYSDYRQQLAKVKGAYELASATWPEGFAPDAKSMFETAFKGWDFSLYLWELKINNKDNPVEPDVNGYVELIEFAGKHFLTKTHPSDYIVEAYRGKKYLPFDENIGLLLGMASDDFEFGRNILLEQLP
jgi:hypothetical protein